MQENTRQHDRLEAIPVAGKQWQLEGILPKPVTLYLPSGSKDVGQVDLWIHFHGASYIPVQSVEELRAPLLMAVVNLGSGSSVYAHPFENKSVFEHLIKSFEDASGKKIGHIYCSGFSAGYGAVRELLRQQYDKIDGVLLLDGLHTSYVPERVPLALGGKIDDDQMQPFLRMAQDAMKGKKTFLFSHSTVFPGTFSSTTETSDWLLENLQLQRTPVLVWGPMGMQQVSDTHSGNFRVMGFAGNSAPDHMDHLHGLKWFMERFFELEAVSK